jgi:hypothetical protein
MESQPLPVLRPLRLGELLDQAIRLYRRNFITFIGIIALVYVPLMVLQTASTTLLTGSMNAVSRSTSIDELFSNYAYWIGVLSTIVTALLQFIFVQGIATGALTRAVADNYLGKNTSILDAYRGIGRSWVSLLGALLLVILAIIVLLLWWIIVPCLGWFTGLGMLAFLGVAVNPIVAPVVVLESQGAVESIRRAWFLTRRRFWPVLGTVFVLYLFNLLIVNGPITVVNLLLTTADLSIGNDTTQLIITAVIQSVVAIVFVLIYYPLQMTAFTLIYFDLRVRTEGFDLALLASGNADQALSTPVSGSREMFVTGTDMGNFAILTIAAFGVYIFLFAFIFGGIFFLTSLFG